MELDMLFTSKSCLRYLIENKASGAIMERSDSIGAHEELFTTSQ